MDMEANMTTTKGTKGLRVECLECGRIWTLRTVRTEPRCSCGSVDIEPAGIARVEEPVADRVFDNGLA